MKMIEIEKAAKAFWKERHAGIDYREADSIPGSIAINDIIAFAAFCLDKSDRYWRIRCELAEKCLEESPCDPDISAEQIAAHKSYNEFLKNNIEP